MKERTLTYLVIVLVVVNVAALGTIIYQRITGPFWNPDRGNNMMSPLDVPGNLSLRPEQRQFLRDSRHRMDSLMTPIHEEIGKKRLELMSEMSNNQPDTIKIDQLVTEIGALQIQIEKTMVHNLIEDSKSFSPEQRDWFLKNIRQRARWQDKPMMGPGQRLGPGGNRDRK
jgi:Spy/CpxP family protein refolding chaperone